MPIAVGGVGTWSFEQNVPSDAEIVEYYRGYIYVIGVGETKAYNLLDRTWATLSGGVVNYSYDFKTPAVFCNGKTYRYLATYSIFGDDPTYKSDGYLYECDVTTGAVTRVYYAAYNGIHYASIAALNGKVFLAGGEWLEWDTGMYSNYDFIDAYDPDDPDNGLRNVGLASSWNIYDTAIYGDDIYYFGASYSSNYIEDHTIGKFNSITYECDEINSTGIQYVGYTGETACAINENEIYIVGGEGNMNGVRYFDFDSGDWYTCSSLTYGRKNAAVEYYNGYLYVLGGYDENDNYLNNMEVYNISTKTWTSKSIGNSNLKITDGHTCLYNGKLYAMGNGNFGVYGLKLNAKKYYDPQHISFELEVDGFDSYREQTLAHCGNEIYAWGEGYYADGTDSMFTVTSPYLIDHGGQIKFVKQVCRGKNHNLILDGNGNVWGWGSNTNYPMGNLDGKVKTVTKLSVISNVRQVAAGAEFSIFLKNDGTLWGVGKNDVGQLGQGLTSDYCSTPVRIAPTLYFDYVDASEEYVVAITTGGQIYTWGGNMKGQLGNGGSGSVKTGIYAGVEYDNNPKAIDITLPSDETFEKVAAGINFCLALTSEGNVYAWGDNGSAQLGQGNKANNYKPYKISKLSDITDIAAGRNSALATKNNGETVYGWGEGRDGQLGFYTSGSILSPTEITALDGYDITQISCGDDFTIVSRDNGYSLYSFGNNGNGALGILN